ncbi:mitochondrial ribosomal protein L59 [Andalucia godoyi]|uniref:Mitochondrial ribosomal protein L59 n=1 Tax=Andalucia godoyi TaxID=505711 RepID=A0A8K0AK64_ANDGO|nr:mitochondrial ribosomal protein L59 [Andalucia godoyi]|eukprot:ANDGO_02458.mRNA.1 putative mitochondrial protein
MSRGIPTARIPSILTRLAEVAVPTKVNGVWHKPMLSGRKRALLAKTPEFVQYAASNPDAVKLAKMDRYLQSADHPDAATKTSIFISRVPKGHKHARDAEARRAAIQKKLAEMPKLLEDIKKQKQDAKKSVGISWLFKENAYK